MNTHELGIRGENEAVEYLKKQKYKVLQRNFRCHYGEIDIVAKEGEYYVFVEVKLRTTYSFGAPREAVDYYKQKTIVQCASRWMYEKRLVGAKVRFDVVEVYSDRIALYRDAFRPT